jgi:hypothetical protein
VTTLNGSAVSGGDQVLVQSQQHLSDTLGVDNAVSTQTANSSSVKNASSHASAQLVIPSSIFNFNFGKRRRRSAPLVDNYKFTKSTAVFFAWWFIWWILQ